jgi:hypothetical protein
MDTNLHIHEKIFLLALRDKEGTVFPYVNYRHALAGALLAELILKQFVSIETARKQKYLKLEKRKATGDPLLDECISKIAKAKRRAQLKTWVQRFSSIRELKSKTAKQLCRKGILKEKEEKVLFIFKQKLYPEINHKPEKELIDKMEKVIFGNSKVDDPEIIILISLCNSANLLNKIFDRKKIKAQKKRIKDLVSGNLIGKATQDAIEAMQAAVMVAAIIPAVSVATTT